jgi:hypothetical protein
MSQDANKSLSLSLYPTGVKLLGRTEFLRRVNAGEKAIDVNVDAMWTRDRETEKLIDIIGDKMSHLSPECFQMDSCLQIYLDESERHVEIPFLNDLVEEHAPMLHRGGMTFEYDNSFQGTDCFILDYKCKVA